MGKACDICNVYYNSDDQADTCAAKHRQQSAQKAIAATSWEEGTQPMEKGKKKNDLPEPFNPVEIRLAEKASNVSRVFLATLVATTISGFFIELGLIASAVTLASTYLIQGVLVLLYFAINGIIYFSTREAASGYNFRRRSGN